MRWVIGVLGVGLLGWGVVELVPVVFDSPLSLGGWLLGGPVLHDALLAPLVAVGGVVVSRVLPPRWRAPVGAGLVVSGVLVVLSIPYLWRTFSGPVTPGLHDRPYLAGLLIALAVVWTTVVITGLVRRENTPATP
ncbi:hypothetical protein ACFFQW_25815 [Umezawaea endophytica]|uniref:Uncharacterized protein n=1 Tax=Umezawaea endophytica TaxID=1654476 RepID=A0A9X3AFS4_9PSEU|nr:hypothetical protein [Umezawaea endophytica]MCS7479102.1 hypothetical protein [Umezawaea endophytica]